MGGEGKAEHGPRDEAEDKERQGPKAPKEEQHDQRDAAKGKPEGRP